MTLAQLIQDALQHPTAIPVVYNDEGKAIGWNPWQQKATD